MNRPMRLPGTPGGSPMRLVLALIACAIVRGAEAHQHGDEGTVPERLGTVHFATSCAAAVEKDFDRGIALLHSFWFSAARSAFKGVLDQDKDCAIANWGIALSLWGNQYGEFRSPRAVSEGAAAIERGIAAKAGTVREHDYIAAAALLFQDADTMDQRTRTVAYEHAMEALAARYPEDPEARIFYALALGQTQLKSDKTYANLLKAGAILEQELVKQPNHPGISHYIIHSYDVPSLAPRAIDAANRYAKIAPDAPHALHMPSHTFTRVGDWQASIAANIASAAAARKEHSPAEELHALEYQTYAYLQTGQDQAAQKVLEAIQPIGERIQLNAAANAAPAPSAWFALAAIPARYALERNDWEQAMNLPVRPSTIPWIDAVTHFARAYGAARAGHFEAAQKDVDLLEGLANALRGKNDAYWEGQVRIQAKAAAAWIAYRRGRREEALQLMADAATMEDATEKSPLSPGPLKPARESLGELLLELDRPGEALTAFEATMEKEPNRFRSVYGAAVAARKSGDARKARAYFTRLATICEAGDQPGRPALQEARGAGDE